MRWLPALAVALLLAGCGDDEPPPLTVSAAASLQESVEEYAQGFGARLSFGGSDALAAQVRRGVRPDVVAFADAQLVRDLHAEGLVEVPQEFATNQLVVAVPARSRVGSIADLGQEGVRIAIGAMNVPVGRYAMEVIDALPAGVAANVRSEEPDVTGIVAKLLQGAADAGIVYRTDVAAAAGRLRAIELPRTLSPRIAYAAAVVEGTERPEEAARFVAGLSSAPALRSAGFGPP